VFYRMIEPDVCHSLTRASPAGRFELDAAFAHNQMLEIAPLCLRRSPVACNMS
jgi:hypothetical protein